MPRLVLKLGLALGLMLAGALAAAWVADDAGVAPRLAGGYIEQRSLGHTSWIVDGGRRLKDALTELDRGNTTALPALPRWAGASAAAASNVSPAQAVNVSTPQELVDALARANPGETILLAPGHYRFADLELRAARPGKPQAPVTVRARAFGTAVLEFAITEGFHVTAPYWRFEDLSIQGACATHDMCEHAFHIVGAAHHVTVRNNVIRDFNAHIKINGRDRIFPDAGQVIGNTLTNSEPRKTENPVTLIDLVGASRWSIEGNLIADFIKAGGDATSYGAFAKGASTGTRFLRNVVLCEARLRGQPGRRVGLSFGGGGTGASVCRDGKCVVEHQDGVMAGNLIAGCSDDGIYVNRAPGSNIVHNTLLDTAGIEVRFAESVARLAGNLVDGPVRARDGAATVDDGDNELTPVWALYVGWHPVRELFADAALLDLRFKAPPPDVTRGGPQPDLCLPAATVRARPGAFDDIDACHRARLRGAGNG